MQTIICILGAASPLVVVFFVWAGIRAPLKRFLKEYLDESLANLASLFVCLVTLFYAVRLSVESLAGLRAGVGRFVSGVVGPGLGTCDSIISFLMWAVNVVALFFIGRAIMRSGGFRAKPGPDAAPGCPERSD